MTEEQTPRRGRRPKDPRVILDALEALLESTPLHEVSVEDVLGPAGVSRATFYAHFSTKHQAVTSLLDRVIVEIEATMRTFVASSDDVIGLDALRRGIDDSIVVWLRHQAVLRTIVENAHAVPEFDAAERRIKARFALAIALAIERERRAGRAPEGLDARELSSALVECTVRLLYRSSSPERSGLPGPEQIAGIIMALWGGSVFGQPRLGLAADPVAI